jgi:hypothetical protein
VPKSSKNNLLARQTSWEGAIGSQGFFGRMATFWTCHAGLTTTLPVNVTRPGYRRSDANEGCNTSGGIKWPIFKTTRGKKATSEPC